MEQARGCIGDMFTRYVSDDHPTWESRTHDLEQPKITTLYGPRDMYGEAKADHCSPMERDPIICYRQAFGHRQYPETNEYVLYLLCKMLRDTRAACPKD